MNKKRLNIYKLLFCLFILINTVSYTTFADTKPPKLNAESAILMDADTGQVLYSKNGYDKHFPASTTKVLTALVVLEHTKLNDIVTIGKNPPFADGSSIGLKEGEKFTVEDLLTGLLLESGNDCAEALAEYVGGSIENFSRMMNATAEKLGATQSNFVNPNGLPNPDHVSTAYDLALILSEAIKNPDFVRISRIISKELPPSNLDGAVRWTNNHNHMINPNSKYFYKYALAGKSGYTVVANHTFVISAQKDGRTLVASFLNAKDKNQNFKDMAALLDYGFNNFDNLTLYKKGSIIENIKVTDKLSIPLETDRDVIYSENKDTKGKLDFKLSYELPKNIRRIPLEKGEVITVADLIVNGEPVEKINLVSGISRSYDLSTGLMEIFQNNKVTIIGLIAVIFITIFAVIHKIRSVRKKRAFHKKWGHIRKKNKSKSK